MKRKLINFCVKQAENMFPNHLNWQHHAQANFFHFSFLVQNNTILSIGMNHLGKVPPGYPQHSMTHSEAHAIDKGRHRLNLDISFEMLNLRLTKTGKLKISKPCNSCYSFLNSLGCKRVYFSTDAGIARLDF